MSDMTNQDSIDMDMDHERVHRAARLRDRRVRWIRDSGCVVGGLLATTALVTGTAWYLLAAATVATLLIGWPVLDRCLDNPLRRELKAARTRYVAVAHSETLCAEVDRLETRLPWWSVASN